MNVMYVWLVNIKTFESNVVLNFGDEILLRGKECNNSEFLTAHFNEYLI